MKKFLSFVLTIATIAAVCYGVYTYIIPVDKPSEFKEDYGTEVTGIKMDVSLLEIKIKEGKSFTVEYEGSEKLRPDCKYDESSKSLVITQPEYKPKKSRPSDNNKLTITFPKDTRLGEFNASLNMGVIEAGKLSADQLHLATNMADIDIDKCDTKDMAIVSNLGDVEIDLEGDIKDFTISASVSLGNLRVGSENYNSNYVQTGTAGTIKIECNLGNVELK
ncbi:DUF4097 family beta strand repeat-containing protein [Butyrivibrio sp. VCB2006]|uniref:DUF4097 family beta strand repeat-containing protein n=1 Tax=Butyrivibrio sp. VCB2006 TaxID=1280679 RepID=UPI00041FF00D|nr:DUF4097 family beta strand repeat-containing protein [Butyrivibrio sp. VCB2006]